MRHGPCSLRCLAVLVAAALTIPSARADVSGFTDLGFALAGAGGEPLLVGTGALSIGSPAQLALSNAAPSSAAGIFLAVDPITPLPFRQGTLVPFPFALLKFANTNPAGEVLLSTSLPVGTPIGLSFYVQWAIVDAGAPANVALSNALQGVVSETFVSPGALFHHPRFPVISKPISMAIGDLDHDGTTDLVVAHNSFGSNPIPVSVLLAAGDGLYCEYESYVAGGDPNAVEIADLDQDGALDLVVANEGSGDVSVLLGVGDGTFNPAQHFHVGGEPYDVAIADLNEDGLLDLGVTHSGNPQGVSVLLGFGDGTFSAAERYSAAGIPRQLRVCDMNLDGHLDFVVSNHTAPAGVSVVLGAGDGTFDERHTYGLDYYPRGIAVGDLDEDGIPDVAVSVWDGDGGVMVIPGRGDGTLFPNQAVAHYAGGDSTLVEIADMDGDGRRDLIVASFTDTLSLGQASAVGVMRGTGAGSFAAPEFVDVGRYPQSLAIGDLTQDGVLDVAVVAGALGLADAGVFTGLGDGTFLSETRTYPTAASPGRLLSADLNSDGFTDLLIDHWSSPDISVMWGVAGGEFVPGPTSTVGDGEIPLMCVDLDDDGFPDLVWTDTETHVTYRLPGLGDGTFGARVNLLAGADYTPVAAEDLNQNDRVDLVLSDDDEIRVLLRAEDGSYELGQKIITSKNTSGLGLADLNEDGILDLVTPGLIPAPGPDDLAVSIYLGVGDGTFALHQQYTSELFGWNPQNVWFFDVNQDTHLDLYLGGATPRFVLFGAGDGTFTSPAAVNGPNTDPPTVLLADLDDDGSLDAITRDVGDDVVSIYPGDGTGSFGAPVNFFVGDGPSGWVIADFDQDRRLDLAVTAAGSDRLWILINQLPD